MNRDEFFKNIKSIFKHIDLDLFIKQIDQWILILRENNKKYNLTRLDSDQLIYQDYFYASILPYSDVKFFDNCKLLDIGSGSGIPGILLKLVFPTMKLTIIDSNNKKCNFMKLLVEQLKLKDVQIINDRCEVYAHKVIETFDFVTCRAVAELKIILELAIPVLKINGEAIFLKSLMYQQEIENAQNISKKLLVKQPQIFTYYLNDKTLITLVYSKDNKTNSIYPRSWKEIIS